MAETEKETIELTEASLPWEDDDSNGFPDSESSNDQDSLDTMPESPSSEVIQDLLSDENNPAPLQQISAFAARDPNQPLTEQEAHEGKQVIVSMIHNQRKNFVQLGKMLYYYNSTKAYKKLGYKTFREFLSIPEIDLKKDTAYRLIQVYSHYIEHLQIPSEQIEKIDYTKLHTLIPYTNDEDTDNTEDLLSVAQTTSTNDLNNYLKSVPTSRESSSSSKESSSSLDDDSSDKNITITKAKVSLSKCAISEDESRFTLDIVTSEHDAESDELLASKTSRFTFNQVVLDNHSGNVHITLQEPQN